ncbi:MAG: hypothetical protein U5K51_14265 [Flavobacteriaceae bacterium]|nr:hypothetical protein [Flavobacteriaceae bacterium]
MELVDENYIPATTFPLVIETTYVEEDEGDERMRMLKTMKMTMPST